MGRYKGELDGGEDQHDGDDDDHHDDKYLDGQR